jgi:hypothetical protein
LNPGWFEVEPIQVVLTNESDDPVLVDWDKSALVSPEAETLRIIHSGVHLADAKAGNYQTYQKESLIAPHAKLTDVVSPIAWIHRIQGEWHLCFAPDANSRFVASFTFVVGGKSMTLAVPFVLEEGRLVRPD